MSFLFYKRPPYVAKRGGHLTEWKKSTHESDCGNTSIPRELCFENVICNKCMSPCSLQDFLDYLMYVTHDAENLQFYLWMVDYFQRFRSASEDMRALSPRWTDHAPLFRDQNGDSLIGTQDLDIHSEDISECSTWGGEQSEFTDQYTQTLEDIKFSISPVKQQRAHAQLQWHPTAGQPFRGEINRIIKHYLAPGSPRQLNLSRNDSATVLRALEYTTHPSALKPVKKMLDSTLRHQSHPNFVRWSISNGNKQWTYAIRAFAVVNMTIGFVIAITLTLSRASRYWRIFAALEWWLGITNIIAASQGLCILLHRLHTRQYHAWERSSSSMDDDDDDEAILKGGDVSNISYESTRSQWPLKMEVFGPANNYSGEAWVSSYARKPWYRKLFEKRIKVQESGLSSIQNRMIRQAEAWALVITVPLTVALVAIPNANLF
ncbi:MAG: hypothetical protein Q9217_003101 [Psora testacea]